MMAEPEAGQRLPLETRFSRRLLLELTSALIGAKEVGLSFPGQFDRLSELDDLTTLRIPKGVRLSIVQPGYLGFLGHDSCSFLSRARERARRIWAQVWHFPKG